MLVVGGCELSLERNPYSTIEVIRKREDGSIGVESFNKEFPIAVRSPMAYMDEQKQKLYLFGGCRGSKDHISDI